MPAVRRILGHVSVETVKAKHKCHRNPKKHKICRGEACLVVRHGNGNRKNYCSDCAPPILELAQADLDDITARLSQ